LKQEVSRKGHRDVLVPCPENTALDSGRRPHNDDKHHVNNVAGIYSLLLNRANSKLKQFAGTQAPVDA
jgi:hypothetical protein